MRVYLVLIFLLIIMISSLGSVFSHVDFEASSPIIKSVVKEGESVSVPISIINHGKRQEFNIEHFSETDFIYIENKALLLGREQGGAFNIVLNSNDYSPNVYVGETVVRAMNHEDNYIMIPVIFEIETHSLNFDISSEIDSKLSELSPGGKLNVEIKVYNLGSESGDVSLHYEVKDIKGKLIISEDQELNVNNQAEISKTFLIPNDLEFRNYVFSVSANDKNSNSVGTSSSLFSISKQVLESPEDSSLGNYLVIALIIIFILIISFLFINYYWDRRVKVEAKEWKKRLVDVKKVKFSDIGIQIRKLEYQKRLLDEAHNKGYITRNSYLEGREKLNSLILKLKKRL